MRSDSEFVLFLFSFVELQFPFVNEQLLLILHEQLFELLFLLVSIVDIQKIVSILLLLGLSKQVLLRYS